MKLSLGLALGTHRRKLLPLSLETFPRSPPLRVGLVGGPEVRPPSRKKSVWAALLPTVSPSPTER